MEENNKNYINEIDKIINVVNDNLNSVIIFWDSNIYTQEEQNSIVEKAHNLNYYLIDSKLANLAKIIESCRELILRESARYENNIETPLIVLKEDNIKNEYVFNFPTNSKAMYNLLQEDVDNYLIILLTKQDSKYDKDIYINYKDFINGNLKEKELISSCEFEYIDQIKNYSINYLIPTFINTMQPKIKYELIKESDNVYLLKNKKHQIRILIIDDINKEQIDIFKYNLIIESNSNIIPNESILQEKVINELYKKESNLINIIRR